jgi:hypothetical protein
MRIALCISGQPRTWKKAYDNWLEKILPGEEKDIFFHFWDYNTLPTIIKTQPGIKNIPDVPITPEERTDIVCTLNPKKHIFDSRNLNPVNGEFDKSLLSDWVDEPLGWWCRSQYYSLLQSAMLKRQYEIENKFEYDIVFRMRTDLYFLNNLNLPNEIKPNELYSKSNGWMDNVETFMIGDTFYFSDSYTYDQVANFGNALKYIDTRHTVSSEIKCPPPEVALYNYLCSIGVKNVSCPQNIKILRNQDYVDIRGGLLPYEII